MVGETLSVTVDIEDWYHIPSVTGSSFSVYRDTDEFFRTWDQRYDFLSQPTEQVLKILEDYAIRATFFVVADVVDHYPGLVESIADKGHEIACHGLHHACKIDPKTRQALISQQDFEKRTRQSKMLLENISRQKITGYRAPNALIGQWMWESLYKIGFTYDSSISVNSLYTKTDHIPQGVTSAPYYPLRGHNNQNSDRANFLEFPFSYLETCGIKIPTSGGPMLRFLGKRIILKGLRQSMKRGHTTFYVHPIDICNEKFPRVGKGRPLYWIVKGKVVENRLKWLLNNLKDVHKIPLNEYSE